MKRSSGFTLIELLVVISIIGILASLAIPAVTSALTRGQLTQTLNNARQLTLATQQMSLDSTTTGSGPSWTTSDGSTQVSLQDFFNNLVTNNYLTANDIKKLISAPGVQQAVVTTTNITVNSNTCSLTVFETTEGSANDQAFVVTKNWSAGALTTNTPYAKKGFVVFRKGGDGAIYTRPSDAANYTNTFGVTNSSDLKTLN